MIPAPLRATLTGVADQFAAARDPWWVVTGAAVALHGGATDARDVDILVSRADAVRLLGDAAAPGLPSVRYRSALFGTLDGLPLPVEIMADFQFRTDGRWQPVRFATREAVRLDEATLFVPGRLELAALLTALGRDKDRARLASLGC